MGVEPRGRPGAERPRSADRLAHDDGGDTAAGTSDLREPRHLRLGERVQAGQDGDVPALLCRVVTPSICRAGIAEAVESRLRRGAGDGERLDRVVGGRGCPESFASRNVELVADDEHLDQLRRWGRRQLCSDAAHSVSCIRAVDRQQSCGLHVDEHQVLTDDTRSNHGGTWWRRLTGERLDGRRGDLGFGRERPTARVAVETRWNHRGR